MKKLQYISTNLQLETLEIVPSSTVRDLGVYLDSSLDMHVHISKIVSAGFYHLRRLRQLRHVLNRERRQKLVSALILSRVDYCNSVLVGLPLNTISPLRRLLNAAARFVAGLRSRDHVTAALRDLHWLKIDQRITFKLCVLMHSIVYGYSPQYMADMVTSVSSLPSRTHLRSASDGMFDVPRTRIRQGSQAFSVAGPRAWNTLPTAIKLLSCRATFKRHLKTFLFVQSYDL